MLETLGEPGLVIENLLLDNLVLVPEPISSKPEPEIAKEELVEDVGKPEGTQHNAAEEAIHESIVSTSSYAAPTVNIGDTISRKSS